MKVNGIQLREAIKRWELRAQTASKQFNENVWAFDGDDAPSPEYLAAEYAKAQESVARIQAAQSRYNLLVTLDFGSDEKITLCEAVKRIGGAGRLDKMWRAAANNTGRDRYSIRENQRNSDTIYAKRQISVEKCVKEANEASKRSAKLRSMIAIGNTAEVELENLEPELFE